MCFSRRQKMKKTFSEPRREKKLFQAKKSKVKGGEPVTCTFFLGHGFSLNSTMHPYPNTFNGLYMGLGFVRLWWSDFGHHHLGETMTFPTSRTSQAVMLATPSLFRFGPAIFPILETSLTVIDLLHFHMFRPVDHLSFNKKERRI